MSMIAKTTKSRNTIKSPKNINEDVVLVFDFETNGLPEDPWADFHPEPGFEQWDDGNLRKRNGQPIPRDAANPDKWPNSVQFCYIIYNNKTNEMTTVNELVKMPVGAVMGEESEAIHHISKEDTEAHGKDIRELMDTFMDDFKTADVIVAHNLRFDKNLLLAELKRLTMREDIDQDEKKKYELFMMEFYNNKKEYCTAKFGTDECKTVGVNKNGKEYYKMPKLMNLYKHLFGHLPDEDKLHDAKADVIICLRCFYKLYYDVDIYTKPGTAIELIKDIDDITPNMDDVLTQEPEIQEPEIQEPKIQEPEKIGGSLLNDLNKKIDAREVRGDDIILDLISDVVSSEKKDSSPFSSTNGRRSSRLSVKPEVDYAEGVNRKSRCKRTRKKKNSKKDDKLKTKETRKKRACKAKAKQPLSNKKKQATPKKKRNKK